MNVPTTKSAIHSTYQSSNKIDIVFNGISSSDICLTSIGPATTLIDLGTPPNGTYKLNIKVGQASSSGELMVSANKYSISLGNKQQLQLSNPFLQRIPANTIWGTIGYHTTSSETIVQNVINDLQRAGAVNQTYTEGDYGYFQVNGSGQILPPQNHGYWFVHPFSFKYGGNLNEIKNLLQHYKNQYGNAVYINIYTTNGEELRS